MSQNKAIAGFLFDLDGVLIDSERTYTRIWSEIEADYPTGVPDFARAIKGMALHNILDKYFPAHDVRRAVEQRCLDAQESIEYNFMPGARALLQELARMGVPMAMVTSSDKEKMHALSEKLPELFTYFDAIVDGDMVVNGKPDPEPYLTGASRLGLSAHQCAVVEDSLAGIESGRRAGALVVGMTDTLGREAIAPVSHITLDSLEQLNPQKIINIIKAGS